MPLREAGSTVRTWAFSSFLPSVFTSFLLPSFLCFKNDHDGESVSRNRTVCCSVLLLDVQKAVAADTPEFGQRRILSFPSRPLVPVEMDFSKPGRGADGIFPMRHF